MEQPAFSRYFAKVDMERPITHQTRFIASIMGGPPSFYRRGAAARARPTT